MPKRVLNKWSKYSVTSQSIRMINYWNKHIYYSSRLSNQATQDTEAQAQEERKLQLYSEFSSTLSKFSAKGTASIMPNLADVLLRNAERKQRIDNHFKSIAELWEQAFENFMTEISHAMSAQLETTLTQIHKAGDPTCNPITANSAASKRQMPQGLHSQDSVEDRREWNGNLKGYSGNEKESSFSGSEHRTPLEHKRQRCDAPSPSSSETTQKAPQHNLKEFQPYMQEILSQMKLKIDEQAQSLQKLMKENHEVKSR